LFNKGLLTYLLTYVLIIILILQEHLVVVAAVWTCPKGFTRCYGSRQCVLDYYFDDGENDCNVGTDEIDEFLGYIPLRSNDFVNLLF